MAARRCARAQCARQSCGGRAPPPACRGLAYVHAFLSLLRCCALRRYGKEMERRSARGRSWAADHEKEREGERG